MQRKADSVSQDPETGASHAWFRIDREHVELSDAIDEIKKATEAERAPVLKTYLRDFHLKAKSHFEFEEEVMKRYGYPFYGDHKSQHDDLVSSLEGAINGAALDEPVRDLLAVMTHLTHELQHCIAADRHLKVFLIGP